MASAVLGSPLRSFARLALYAGFTVPLCIVQLAAMALRLPFRKALPFWYHRQCARVMGIQTERRGRQSRSRPTLYISNHVSYLDIMVLGALVQGSFVAKADVRRWPFFGWLARLQDSIFVECRASRSAAHRDEIVRRLEAGENLILFAEGTSSDGNRVLPFKSELLSVVEAYGGDAPLVVQPVSIAYTKLDGLPLGRHLRPLFAWYGDMDLLPHLWQLAGLGRLTVVVHFHKPVEVSQLASRKALSEHCQSESARGLSAALSGRRVTSPAEKAPTA